MAGVIAPDEASTSPSACAASVSADHCSVMFLSSGHLSRPRSAHDRQRHDARRERDGGHEMNRGSDAHGVGDDPRKQRSNRIAEIAPKAIYAEARCAPQGVSMVGYRREQRGIDHGGSGPLQARADEPGPVVRNENGDPYTDSLHDHSASDQATPADLIRQRPGRDLE